MTNYAAIIIEQPHQGRASIWSTNDLLDTLRECYSHRRGDAYKAVEACYANQDGPLVQTSTDAELLEALIEWNGHDLRYHTVIYRSDVAEMIGTEVENYGLSEAQIEAVRMGWLAEVMDDDGDLIAVRIVEEA